MRQLVRHSGHSRDKLFSIIAYWLSYPPPSLPSLELYRHLIFDGTFLEHPRCIVALMDGETNTVIAGRYKVSESSVKQLMAFFSPLKEKGLSPLSCTTDGSPAAIQVIRMLWPGITIQRCLVHIQRQGLSWCRVSPRTIYGKRLSSIFSMATKIKTKEERDKFLELLGKWEERYGKAIATRPERGPVFSDIKRARSMLLNALPDMFHHLDNPAIPPTTNGLEGYFTRLKSHYRQHRGLSREKRRGYFSWFFYYKPR